MNKMYEYLSNHNYISKNENKNPLIQQELSKARAECIAYKYDNLVKELQQENEELKQMVNYQKGKFIDYLNGSILSYNVIANGIEDSDYKEEIMAKIRAFNEVLINFKHIIGDDNNEQI